MKRHLLISLIIGISSVLLMVAGCQRHTSTETKGPSAGKVTTGDRRLAINDQVVHVKFSGEDIYGHLYTPKKHGKQMPVAIVAHGLGGTYQELGGTARHLASRGYMTYAFDFPGGSSSGQSTGVRQTQMSIETEAHDLTAVIKAITARSAAASGRTVLVGGSQGGVVAGLVASRHPKLVDRLALMYPAFSMTHDARSQYQTIGAVPRTTDVFGFTVGRAYYRALLRQDVTKTATTYRGPVLIVHGDADDIVPIKYVRQAAANYQHGQLHVLSGAGHGFEGHNQRQALKLLDKFINTK